LLRVSVIRVVTIVAIAPIITGFINLTSLSDCKVIINDSDYETTVKVTRLIMVLISR